MRALMCCVVVCVITGAGADEPAIVPLKEGWRLQSAAKVEARDEEVAKPGLDVSSWITTDVPKTVLAALAENGVYPDPYYGLNMKAIPGFREDVVLAMPEDSPFRGPWWYRVEFTLPEEQMGRFVTLHLDGINLRAEVWLNGERLANDGDVVGMFRRFNFSVGGKLRFGEPNALALKVTGPGQIPEKDYDTKQIEATTGWDDHNPWPPDLNTGVWEDVYLRAHGPITIAHPYVETDLDLPSLDTAKLAVSAFLTNHGADAVHGELKAEIGDIIALQEVSLEPGETREIVLAPEQFAQLIVSNPRIWWPVNMGTPELYELALTAKVDGAVSDNARTRFGIREVRTYINEENWRAYEVNGKPVLIRGGAWMTSDMLLRLTHERYEALVRYARDGGLNMLRSEGFSLRETDEFYDLCDEYGVMVTQQIFGRSIPDEKLALACIDDMMLRLRSHPSLVHFLGHDETYPTQTLDEGYQALIAKYRVNRTYQPHSGTFFVPERTSTGGTRTGTRELWTYVSPEHYYRRTFDGAWGFAQSGGIGGIVAHPDSLRAMMPADQLWPALETEAWSLHSVTQGAEYFDTFRKCMEAGYGAPADLADFCRKAYAMNYNSARGMFEAYGRNKYKATGITTWKYDAAWPAAITWQYIDWYLRPTAAYYGAKKACEPVHVQFAYDDRNVYVINGTLNDYPGLTVSAKVFNDDLSTVFERSGTVDVAADGKAAVCAIPEPDGFSMTHFLLLELRDAAGNPLSDNFYWLSKTPDIPGQSGHNLRGLFWTKPKSRADFTALSGLPEAAVTATLRIERAADEMVGRVDIRNEGGALAFQVMLDVAAGPEEASIAPAYWSDNFFSLLPGASRTITVRVPAAVIGDRKPVLRIAGWNTAPVTVAAAE